LVQCGVEHQLQCIEKPVQVWRLAYDYTYNSNNTSRVAFNRLVFTSNVRPLDCLYLIDYLFRRHTCIHVMPISMGVYDTMKENKPKCTEKLHPIGPCARCKHFRFIARKPWIVPHAIYCCLRDERIDGKFEERK
jgi:hypothetical protein